MNMEREILYGDQTVEPRFVGDSSRVLESAGHRPSTIPAWGDNPRFSHPKHAKG
jgi:hypothetical protein